MSRPLKKGVDYFSLDCHLDDKWRFIEASFGLIGFAVVVKLLQKIYGEQGYYCEWDSRVALLFSRDLHLDGGNVVQEVVDASLNEGIFDKGMYHRFHILTSGGIQKRYKAATYKRENFEIDERYSLLNDNSEKFPMSETTKRISETQKRMSEINKVNQSKVKESNTPPTPPAGEARVKELFSEWWKEYPKQIDEDNCYQVFCHIKDIEDIFPSMMAALKAQKKTDGWQREYGRYVPNPLKWLKQKQWNYVPDHDEHSFDCDDFFRAAVEHSRKEN